MLYYRPPKQIEEIDDLFANQLSKVRKEAHHNRNGGL